MRIKNKDVNKALYLLLIVSLFYFPFITSESCDVVFVIDNSGSMYNSHINNVKITINDTIDVINNSKINIRVGGLEFSEGVNSISNLSQNYSSFQNWINSLSILDGTNEKPFDALNKSAQLDYLESTKKITFLFTDEPGTDGNIYEEVKEEFLDKRINLSAFLHETSLLIENLTNETGGWYNYGNLSNSTLMQQKINETLQSTGCFRRFISQIQCYNSTNWVNCSDILYGDNLTKVRVNCGGGGKIVNATFKFKNIPDNKIFFDSNATSNESDWWYYDNNDILVQDSGNFLIDVYCINESLKDEGYEIWNVPWGKLESFYIPNKNVLQNQSFSFNSSIKCIGGECGNVSASLFLAEKIFFSDNMENEEGNWTHSCSYGVDLWHLSSDKYQSYNHSWSFNNETNNNYCTGEVGECDLETALIDLSSVDNSSLSFIGWYSVHVNDVAVLRISCDGGINYETLWWTDFGAYVNSHNHTFDISQCAGNSSVKFQYKFYTGTTDCQFFYNDGWYFDDVKISLNERLIPQSNFDPFYTITQNPLYPENLSCLADMKAGDTCNQTWQVNATGNLDSKWQFFVLYESLVYSDVKPNMTNKVNITITNITETSAPEDNWKFYIKNTTGGNVAWFGNKGNLVLKGKCYNMSICTASANSFIIANYSDNTVAYINSTGDLCLEKGDCSASAGTCNPTRNAFIVQNLSGNNMSYIDFYGKLCLTGNLYENSGYV